MITPKGLKFFYYQLGQDFFVTLLFTLRRVSSIGGQENLGYERYHPFLRPIEKSKNAKIFFSLLKISDAFSASFYPLISLQPILQRHLAFTLFFTSLSHFLENLYNKIVGSQKSLCFGCQQNLGEYLRPIRSGLT